MLKAFFKTTIFVVFFFIPQMVFGAVVINEIAWMGTVVDYNDEWLELFNSGDQPIDLAGWTIEAADGTPIINLSGSIPANSYFLLERTDDNSVAGITADQIYTGAMGNSGENLKLKDAASSVIDEINAASSWPAGDNTTKQTMQRFGSEWKTGNPTPKAINSSSTGSATPSEEKPTQQSSTINNPPLPDAGNDIIAFVGQEINFNGTKTTDPEGDDLHYEWNMGDGKLIEKTTFDYQYLYPGTYMVTLMVYDGRNYATDTITVKIQSAQIAINEFMPNPSGKDEESEWIEIYNDSDGIADISGWQLDDSEEGSTPFVFPPNTLIAPKSYLVFSRQITGIALNNDKDVVRLLMPENVVFQEINYEKPPQGKSSAKTGEGFIWSAPTPGTINLSFVADAENKKVVYQGTINATTTKNSAQDNTVQYSLPEKELSGGYAEVAQEKGDSDLKTQLASARQAVSKHISGNLIYIFVIIVLSGMVIGLSLAKFRKKKISTP
jgi:hypothetical protein